MLNGLNLENLVSMSRSGSNSAVLHSGALRLGHNQVQIDKYSFSSFNGKTLLFQTYFQQMEKFTEAGEHSRPNTSSRLALTRP
mmetsp:Transcript_55881/g.147742  ORF Transcript_55881/g.147742 Transcript_55881/m.147742 type:complete len:83 (-) Transcript_55881:1120-1368(-)